MSADLLNLFRKYNSLLLESVCLENDLDDKAEPYFEQEYKTRRLRILSKELEKIKKRLNTCGYAPSEEELRRGFVIEKLSPEPRVSVNELTCVHNAEVEHVLA